MLAERATLGQRGGERCTGGISAAHVETDEQYSGLVDPFRLPQRRRDNRLDARGSGGPSRTRLVLQRDLQECAPSVLSG